MNIGYLSRSIVHLSLGALLSCLTLTSESAEVNLAWDPNSEPDLAGYRVWCTHANGTTTLDVGNVTSTTVLNLDEGIVYSFSVTAYNTAGLESLPSDPVQFPDATAEVAPGIETQPIGENVILGNSFSLSVVASGTDPLQYQWFLDGAPIQGANAENYHVASAQASDAGTYHVEVANSVGTARSDGATVNVIAAPVITRQPASQTVTASTAFSLTVEASGTHPLFYQWFHGGSAIPGATASELHVASAALSDAGDYYAEVSNSAGITQSLSATITLLFPPIITSQPESQSVIAGSEVTFSVQASGSSPLYYQWSRDGSPLSGATAPSLVIASAQTSDSGTYTVTVSNPAGSVTSAGAVLDVTKFNKKGNGNGNSGSGDETDDGTSTGNGKGSNNGKGGKNSDTLSGAAVSGATEIARLPGGALRIHTFGVAGSIYDIQATSTLSPPEWTTIASVAATEEGLVEFSTPDPQVQKTRFYRIVGQ